jgi:hypothetical protein
MTTDADPSSRPRWWRQLDWKGLLATAGLIFGVTQFFITQRSEQEKQRIQLELEEQRNYGAVAIYLKWGDEQLEKLIKRLKSGPGAANSDSTEALKGSMLILKGDQIPDGKGRLGGWPAMLAIHEQARKDHPSQRDQEYRFLRINNSGQRVLDLIYLKFDTGEDATIRNLGAAKSVLIPIAVLGLHANLCRNARRNPVDAFYTFMTLGRAKKKPIDVAFTGDWYATELPGAWQALPEFNK